MIISKFTIQDFKSIESAEIDLGTVNVFIGANGSGKSNLLEALAVLAAAAYGRVDEESLIRRGCRPDGYFKPQFAGSRGTGLTEISAHSSNARYNVTLASPEPFRMTGWEFKEEVLGGDAGNIVDRSTSNGSNGDPHSGLAALRLAETPPDRVEAIFLRTLAAYSIYTPDTPILRGAPDPQNREPIGLAGGRLREAFYEVSEDKVAGQKMSDNLRGTAEWFGGLAIDEHTHFTRTLRPEHRMSFVDRYFQADNSRNYLLGPNQVNEGILYELFLSVLCLHPQAPSLFGLDNGDHGLNPLLAKRLIQAMCGWLLESERPRQVLMTTHNPLVLDGLPLQDDRVRLFTVDRDNRGTTNVRRFVVTDQHREMAAKGWTLSRMWVNKLIGGVPDV